jgi:hypothetical protein
VLEKHTFFVGGREEEMRQGYCPNCHVVAPYHIVQHRRGGTGGLRGCAYMCITPLKSLQEITKVPVTLRKNASFKLFFRKIITFHQFSGYIAILAIVYRYKNIICITNYTKYVVYVILCNGYYPYLYILRMRERHSEN